MRSRLAPMFTAGLLSLQMLGCKEAVSPPPSSAISVSIKVNGLFPYAQFQVEIDGRAMTLLANEANIVARSLPAGTHTVSVVGLPGNCVSDGANPVTVETTPANLSAVEFHVSCVALTGAIAVTATVVGNEAPVAFQAQVDTLSSLATVVGNTTTVFSGTFSGGTHVVKLSQIPINCEPIEGVSKSVSVKTGAVVLDTAVASFSIFCEPLQHAADTSASIVFERNGYLMLMRESSDSAVAVTPGEHPAWSRDGKLISFQRLNCNPSYSCEHDLWTMSADGGNQKPVSTDASFDDYDGAISPSGNAIAFIRFWPGPDATYLAISGLDGSSVRLLSTWYPYYSPTWSPDATQIAFACWGGLSTYMDLCVARTDKACTTYFTNTCTWPVPAPVTRIMGGDELDPAWSPDGRHIAFTISCETGTQSPSCPSGVTVGDPYIAVVDPATAAVTRLVHGHDPAWSRDGTRLVFAGNASSPGLQVYSFADGSVRHLTDNAADISPSWR